MAAFSQYKKSLILSMIIPFIVSGCLFPHPDEPYWGNNNPTTVVYIPDDVFPIRSDGDIEWRVQNPFPLFKKAEDSVKWLPKQNEDLKGQYYDRLAEHYRNRTKREKYVKTPVPYEKTQWSRKNKLYDADYLYPTHNTIQVRLKPSSQQASQKCTWSVEGSRGYPIISSCSHWVALDIPYSHDNMASQLTVKIADYQKTIPIQIEDIVVVGLGDSYASGEGNPDRPAAIDHKDTKLQISNIQSVPDSEGKYNAQWWDAQCNRSLLSSQAMAAMKMATAKAGRVVRFVSFACSGAEINDGMLTRQESPPVGTKFPRSFKNEPVRYSQLDALSLALCRNDKTKLQSEQIGEYKVQYCTASHQRNVNTVLLSIGGNDAGFVGGIGWALLPFRDSPAAGAVRRFVKKGIVCPTYEKDRPRICKNVVTFKNKFEVFKDNLRHLKTALNQFKPQTVLYTQYPDILHNQHSQYCDHQGLKKQWDEKLKGLYSVVATGFDKAKHADITVNQTETEFLHQQLFLPLNETISRHNDGEWSVVKTHVNQFKHHGWCADERDKSKDYSLPLKGKFEYSPYTVDNWYPYDRKQRFLRTPNDSLLTQLNGHISQLYGSFHPTAEGNAVIGDAIYKAWSQE